MDTVSYAAIIMMHCFVVLCFPFFRGWCSVAPCQVVQLKRYLKCQTDAELLLNMGRCVWGRACLLLIRRDYTTFVSDFSAALAEESTMDAQTVNAKRVAFPHFDTDCTGFSSEISHHKSRVHRDVRDALRDSSALCTSDCPPALH
jgi:hypothetical protein